MTHSSNEKNATGTDILRLLDNLGSGSWQTVQSALQDAERCLNDVDDSEALLSAVVQHARHAKWEVRLLVARLGSLTRHPKFTPALAILAADENRRVARAAVSAIRRRRDWATNSLLDQEHERLLNTELDRIESKHGTPARDAVRRTSALISDVVARELYHEAMRLLTPIATSAGKIVSGLASAALDVEELKDEGQRLADRIKRLTRTLDAMRSFTAQPKLTFTSEPIRTIVAESVQQVIDGCAPGTPAIELDIPANLLIEVDRVRIVAALVNVLANAVESYEGRREPPIKISVVEDPARVALLIGDSGSGMTEEARRDAVKLFATSKSKKGGTGFGLPLAVKVVEAEHDGRLLLEAREGGGTVVTITLPRRRTDVS